MHATRQRIVELLKEKGEATVDELAEIVNLTPMAVRYHLNVLQGNNLISSTAVRRQTGPGRPQQMYRLTEAADELFPKDYHGLTDYLLDQLDSYLGKSGKIELFTNIAERMAAEAPPPKEDQTFEERLDEVVAFLSEKGFGIDWEMDGDEYVIQTHSCPYRHVAKNHEEVCLLDKKVISSMLNTTPYRVACLTSADKHCIYRVTKPTDGPIVDSAQN